MAENITINTTSGNQVGDSQVKPVFFKTESETIAWLEKMGVENYQIDANLVVNVIGDVNLEKKELEYFPVQFGLVTGNFNCHKNKLISLKGSPHTVDGSVDCSHNNLVTLQDCPKKIGKSLFCNNNQLISLKGSPEIINGRFYCNNNELTSLLHGPEVVTEKYQCFKNKLTNMLGVASVIGETLYCSNNPLKTLEGIHQVGMSLSCTKTDLELDKIDWSEIQVKQWITLSNREELGYMSQYVTEFDDIEMPYDKFVQLLGLKKLNEKLNQEFDEENSLSLDFVSEDTRKLKI